MEENTAAILGLGDFGKSTLVGGLYVAGLELASRYPDRLTILPTAGSAGAAKRCGLPLTVGAFPPKTDPGYFNNLKLELEQGKRFKSRKQLIFNDVSGQSQENFIEAASKLDDDQDVVDLCRKIEDDELLRGVYRSRIQFHLVDTHHVLNGSQVERFDVGQNLRIAGLEYPRYIGTAPPKAVYIVFTKFDWWLEEHHKGNRPPGTESLEGWQRYLEGLVDSELKLLHGVLKSLPTETRVTMLPFWVKCDQPPGQFLTRPHKGLGLAPTPKIPLEYSEKELWMLIRHLWQIL